MRAVCTMSNFVGTHRPSNFKHRCFGRKQRKIDESRVEWLFELYQPTNSKTTVPSAQASPHEHMRSKHNSPRTKPAQNQLPHPNQHAPRITALNTRTTQRGKHHQHHRTNT